MAKDMSYNRSLEQFGIQPVDRFPLCIVLLYPYKVYTASFTYICISLFHAELYLDLLKIAKKVNSLARVNSR